MIFLQGNAQEALNNSSPKIRSEHSSRITIEDLPDELLLNIFGHLDGPQPSTTASVLYDEPTIYLTNAPTADLKTTSCISKRWRQAVLPLLFRHSRLIIHKPRSAAAGYEVGADIQRFLDFVAQIQFHKVIMTLTLVCYGPGFEKNNMRQPGYHLLTFWKSLFALIDPVEVLIAAPAEALSFFTGCAVNDEESWNFDCPCQYLRLQRPQTSIYNEGIPAGEGSPRQDNQTVESVQASSVTSNVVEGRRNDIEVLVDNEDTSEVNAMITDHHARISSDGGTEMLRGPLFSDCSNLFSRPWSKLTLNEGSFIRGYSTYEFWDRKPHSILSHLLGAPTSTPIISPTIRDMEYIAMFPMEPHFSNITRNFPRLDRLYIQLVPRNNILDNPSKMRQVEAEDLWMQRNICYALLMRELFNAPPVKNFKHLQTFESGDAADLDAWSMAVEYVKRAGNGWKAAEDGVFVRELEDIPSGPEELGDGFEGSAFEGSLTRWAWNGVTKLPVSAQPLYARPLGPVN